MMSPDEQWDAEAGTEAVSALRQIMRLTSRARGGSIRRVRAIARGVLENHGLAEELYDDGAKIEIGGNLSAHSGR